MTHAVNLFAHRDSIMGVLPFGTGNSFAQSLGIPLDDVEAAVGVIARGMPVPFAASTESAAYLKTVKTDGGEE